MRTNRRTLGAVMVGVLAFCVVVVAQDAAPKADGLPPLDGASTKGLTLTCTLVRKEFVTGQPVNIWCRITNTTDRVKPVGWHPSCGAHFHCVREGVATTDGVMPLAIPHTESAIPIKSKPMRPGYILYIGPGETLRIVLTYRPSRPEHFRGQVVYDPVDIRGMYAPVDKAGTPPWADEWLRSNTIEYAVKQAPEPAKE